MSIASKLASSVRQTKEQQETKKETSATASKQTTAAKVEKTAAKTPANPSKRFVTRRCWPD